MFNAEEGLRCVTKEEGLMEELVFEALNDHLVLPVRLRNYRSEVFYDVSS